MSGPEILGLGESAFIVRLSGELDESANARARLIADSIEAEAIPGVTDVVPANCSIGIHFSDETRSDFVQRRLRQVLDRANNLTLETESTLHRIAVDYSGPDLREVAVFTGLDIPGIIEIHAAREYQVFAIGFAPGFGYLGELDQRISVPRRPEPRAKVPAGSVAIANRQTAIYPMETPGGWNIIGRTTERLFDVTRNPASLLSVGDRVRFMPA